MIILNLIQNVALLVALAAAYQVVGSRFEKKSIGYQTLSGLLFGGVGLVGMMTPLHFTQGIIFDGRSIILSVSGLFGGPVVAVIAASMCGAYRLWLGGAGALVGVGVIAEAAALGVLFHFLWRSAEPRTIRNVSLYFFGLLVHVVMLALMLALPGGAGYEVLRRIGLPIIVIYPVAVMLVCRLFLDYERRIHDAKALRESEEIFRKLFQQHSAVKLIIDPQTGAIVDANQAAETFYGWTRETLRSMKIQEINTLTPEEVRAEMARVIREKRVHFEFQHRRADGSVRDVEVFSSNIRFRNKDLLHSIIHDITDRKEAQEALTNSHHRMNQIIQFLPDATFAIDDQGRVTAWNVAMEDLTGIPAEQMLGRGDYEYAMPFYGERRPLLLDLALNWDEAYRDTYISVKEREDGVLLAESYHPTLSGGIFLSGTARVLHDHAGRPIGAIETFRNITEMKKAEKAVRESERRSAQIIEFLPDPIMVIDNRGVIIGWNRAMEGLTGVAASDMIGKGNYEYALPFYGTRRPVMLDLVIDYDQEIASKYLAVEREGDLLVSETFVPDFHGRGPKWFWNVASPLYDGNGVVVGAIEVVRDITDAKRAEEALKKSEEEYRLLAENTLDVIWKMDLDLCFTYVNPAIAIMTGYTVDEWVGTRLSDHCDEENLTRMAQVVPQEIAKGTSGRGAIFEAVMIRKNGEPIHVEIHGKVLFGDDGLPIGLQGVTRDISERKRSEEALRASEERFRILAEGAFEGVVISRDGIILDSNAVFCRMSGYSLEELVGMNVMEMVAPEFKEIARQYVLSGSEEAYESAFLTKDGDVVSVEVKGKPLPYEGGTARIASVRDMSAVRQAEQTERLLATAIEQATEGILVTDPDGVIQYVNPAVERITGYDRKELIGKTPRMFRSGEHDRGFYEAMWGTIMAGRTWSGQLINKRKDGSLQHEEATISPIRDSSGTIRNYVAVKRDVTEQLDLSRQLYQAQKMEAIGTLAGGVAHDFNNILQVALGYSDFILSDEELPEPYRADLKKIHDSAKQGAELVHQLLTFSRTAEIKPRPLNLNHCISEFRKMLERTIPKMIDIQVSLDEHLPRINADKTQIDQVIMNLAVNARDAMPEGGKLIFETADIELDEEYTRTHLDAKPGRYVRLMVSDTGSGMDRDTLEHIFEPFYTTKAVGEGTGLGLAMVHGIVKNHGGHVRCYSEPGAGTIFKIYFPALISDEQRRETNEGRMPRGGSETILLVDDEELIRDLGSRILTKAGYKVMCASDGKEALDLYTARKDEVSLVMLDLIMPEMGGTQCLGSLLSIDPSVKVIIASGFSANGHSTDALVAGAKGFVNKPYDMRQMLEVVRAVLDGE
ncbi:MAG: PAS domain S-box protein [Desulfomonilaceae bacterium]|nr:PAS domain S-box protein [Desulfomonilaceae bacterium]